MVTDSDSTQKLDCFLYLSHVCLPC